MSRPDPSSRALLHVAVSLFVISASPSIAAEWLGQESEGDGIAHVWNPSKSVHVPETLDAEELWRLGEDPDAEDEFFGFVSAIDVDAGGDVYLLDSQLNEVMIYSADGEYLRSIGREGDGPGEFRRPRTMFLTPDGKVAVVQTRPGKIVLLTPDGDPAGEFELPEIEGGGNRMFMGGAACDEHIIVFYRRGRFGTGRPTSKSTLASHHMDVSEVARCFEFTRALDPARPTFDETKSGILVWTTGPDGVVYSIPKWGEYEIEKWSVSGDIERVILRDYEAMPRNEAEKEQARSRFVVRGPREVVILVSDYHPAVRRLFPREDGSLWVLTTRGEHRDDDADGNLIGTFDVFDTEGRFTRQLTVHGEGDPPDDEITIIGDRLYVARHAQDAFSAMRRRHPGASASSTEADEEEEPEPMSVICYRLPE